LDRDNLNHSRNEEGALWSIVGYLLSGLIIWGGIGWGLDQWLETNYFLLFGVVALRSRLIQQTPKNSKLYLYLPAWNLDIGA
jgi:hypothetical protein